MATYGNSTTPSSGYYYDDTGNSQYWSSYGAFPGGTVTDIYIYATGDGAGISARFCIWGSSGTLLWQSGTSAWGSGTRTVGGQGWEHWAGVNTYVAPQTLNLGFWTSGNAVWTFESSGNVSYQRGLSGGPANLSGGGTEPTTHNLGAYILYTPGNAHVMRSGAFVAGQGSVARGGVETGGTFYVMRGGIWVPGA